MKELLENYMNYKADIKSKEYELRRIELEELSIGGSNFDINGDIRPTGYMKSNIENQLVNKADRVIKLQAEINELKAKVDMIDSLVNTLKDYDKEIIRLKYMQNKKDNQIAYLMKKEERTIRYVLKRCIEILDKKYIDFLKIS